MWLTHLEFDATNPFIRHWFDAMGERGRYVRYDARGYGLSDPGARAEQVQAAFLPDVVTYQPSQAASFRPGSGNRRALDDNLRHRRGGPGRVYARERLRPAPAHRGFPLPVSTAAGGAAGHRRPVRPPRT